MFQQLICFLRIVYFAVTVYSYECFASSIETGLTLKRGSSPQFNLNTNKYFLQSWIKKFKSFKDLVFLCKIKKINLFLCRVKQINLFLCRMKQNNLFSCRVRQINLFLCRVTQIHLFLCRVKQMNLFLWRVKQINIFMQSEAN